MLSRALRPLAARAALANAPIRSSAFLGPVSTRTVTNETIESAAVAREAAANTITASTPATTATATLTNPPKKLPYFIGRNTLHNLSIYEKTKAGGNKKLTVLKYIEGDIGALRVDIRDALALSDKDIYINGLTNHIWVKGHKRNEIHNFLLTIGF
ncbi:mitochondrial large subunit ribosomal protein-domain-containing protein [Xylaria sp. CBS 124048]|nr:mitochondrial large subunit ribosomal protein-domain-containing protein [Xylaria sp. CBS 124048]